MEEYCYGTYGELLSGDAEQTAYLYNGMFGVATDENGLYYMRARYYNTDINRFINRDVVKGSINNSQSLNRYSYVQGNPVSLTDPFGLSPFSWSALGHGLLTALGLIPYIGEVFDLINAAWYAKEGRYDMAALCTIAAVPLFGSVASGTLTMFKCAKAAKYVQAVTKVVSNGATFMLATGGNISSIKTIYHNIKNGEIFTKENLYECGVIALNTFTMIHSGKNLASSGKELGGMLKKDVSNVWSKVKGRVKKFGANNGGFVNLDAPVMGGNNTGSRPTEAQGFSNNGYNPKPGERTFQGYINKNVSQDAEVSLYTKFQDFNNVKNAGGVFKRFGTVSGRHGVLGVHVHKPIRNVNIDTGEIRGGVFNPKKGVGVDSPSKTDIKQLYQLIVNNKYH